MTRSSIAPLWMAAFWSGRAEHVLKNGVLWHVNLSVSTDPATSVNGYLPVPIDRRKSTIQVYHSRKGMFLSPAQRRQRREGLNSGSMRGSRSFCSKGESSFKRVFNVQRSDLFRLLPFCLPCFDTAFLSFRLLIPFPLTLVRWSPSGTLRRSVIFGWLTRSRMRVPFPERRVTSVSEGTGSTDAEVGPDQLRTSVDSAESHDGLHPAASSGWGGGGEGKRRYWSNRVSISEPSSSSSASNEGLGSCAEIQGNGDGL